MYAYDDLEKEAEEMLVGKGISELLELKEEVEQNIGQDKSFASDMQYWQNLLKKIKSQVSKT